MFTGDTFLTRSRFKLRKKKYCITGTEGREKGQKGDNSGSLFFALVPSFYAPDTADSNEAVVIYSE